MSLAPWQQPLLDRALAAWRAGRLGHAQLLCGPETLGKRAVAEALAARLLCEAPADQPTCGQCRACVLRAAGTHPDRWLLTFEEVPGSSPPRLRSELVVDQVRRLSETLQMTAQRGGAQVVLIDPADALNHAAANALLKTLEEPAERRYLLLLSSRPQRLPATIRSRCQRLELALPEPGVAIDWLRARGHPEGPAASALAVAGGHPALADAWLREDRLSLRAATLRDWEAVGRGRLSALAVAGSWLAEPDTAALRLHFLADAAAALARAAVGGGPAPAGLTVPADLTKLGLWFDRINQLRRQLALPLRHQLALAGLLLEWRGLLAPEENAR
ncbi:DNA polymerase III subunit delta' [Silanimonas sp.]|uniref:DNA polymerase III subunit delta' n=1 Tax=Silanimonas sp. TaxID=1929290 RepID=UPI001BC02A05|nr:DNA polymerase III subunit delta' [Silanimonas sp.]MBS3895600.1 DNA polymerase III subunit delta' [Silanimonas sp.]MBS3924317.1 DNA polymerase III subunit delta' [Xanthomonadaceae bacterium]